MAQSVWEKETYFAPKDVVIIGCGFVGLWTAYELINKYPKLKITILERGTIPSGASTRNAGFSCFGSVSELMFDIDLMGIENTLETVKMRYQGLQRIQEVFDKKLMDYQGNGGYELFEKGGSYPIEKLKDDINYLNRLLAPELGLKKVYNDVSNKIEQFGFQKIQALAFSPYEGQLHSAKLVIALQQAIQSKGVQILFNTEVKKFKSHSGGVSIQTNLEGTIETKQMVICTNGFAKQLLPKLDVVPARGQVFVTAPIPDFRLKGTFHFDEGYYYFRNVGDRLLLGGARNKAFAAEKTTSLETTALIQNTLEEFMMKRILPKGTKKPKIEMRWSGVMAMGKEKKPIIQEVQPNVYCAVRMNGMGVAIAPIVAQRAVKLMKG